MSDEQQPVVAIKVGAWLKGLTGDSDGLLTSERKNSCFHFSRGAVVDSSCRTLRCSECGARLDPYEYLDFLARDGNAMVRARKMIRELSAKIEELAKQERNARARVKRWQAKADQ